MTSGYRTGHTGAMRVLAAFDKFKGTADAASLCAAVVETAEAAGHIGVALPLADGGEGTVQAFGGANQTTTVTGPLGEPVDAAWRYENGVAVIEMAEAAGLVLAGGAEGNDPVNATTRGVGELIAAAASNGATQIIVGVGGSATTDGGAGAIEALESTRLEGIDLVVACDVKTHFVDAAQVFGPQKGASPAQVQDLTERLRQLEASYHQNHGVDVSAIPGSGAAGGLAGGLAALGARLVDGFELIADQCGLADHIRTADLVVTGEGQFDQTSLEGKVVGGVIDRCAELHTDVLVIAGAVASGYESDTVLSLASEVGLAHALHQPIDALVAVLAEHLAAV
ncbi:MAG: glycerate kinase [Acidimicrobiia bacterium]|nr:glycerate kinase [Acidimicrobiia bacterium]